MTKVLFGDGMQTYCTYENSGGNTNDCAEHHSEDWGTQYCYYVYRRPGTYLVEVSSDRDGDSYSYGSVRVTVIASPPSPTPSPGLLPSPSRQPVYPRGC